MIGWRLGGIVFMLMLAAGLVLDSMPLFHEGRSKAADIADQMNELRALQSGERIFTTKLAPQHLVQSSLLQVLTEISHVTGASLTSFIQAPFDQTRGLFREHASCTLNGTYNEAVSAMMALANATDGLLLRDFTLQAADQGDYLLKIDVFLLNTTSFSQQKKETLKLENPFCAGNDGLPMSQTEDAATLHADSIMKMQMLAYIRQGAAVIAWVRLANGHLVQVATGDVIGHEQMKIEAINETGLVLLSTDGRYHRLGMVGEIK